MPIYEYECGSCGVRKEFLQKMSDAPIAACPECGSEAFSKLISAAGFQLKGTGWYATDFKGGAAKKETPKAADAPAAKACDAGACGCAAPAKPAASSS